MIIILYGVLLAAVAFDLLTYKIPNALIVAGLAVLLMQVGILNGPLTALNCFLRCLLFLILLIPLFFVGALGAGDVKLLSLVGMCVEFNTTLKIVWFSLIAGVILGAMKNFLLYMFSKLGMDCFKISIFFREPGKKRNMKTNENIGRIVNSIERRLLNKGYFKLIEIFIHFVDCINKLFAGLRSSSIHFSIAILFATFIVMERSL